MWDLIIDKIMKKSCLFTEGSMVFDELTSLQLQSGKQLEYFILRWNDNTLIIVMVYLRSFSGIHCF